MKQLKYFIAGIATILFFIPILDKFLEVVLLWIETLKINSTKKILESQKNTLLLREFLFTPSQDLEYEEEYDDED